MVKFDQQFERLSTSNYRTWKTVMMSLLMGKELWDYVIELKYEDDASKLKNEQAKSIIYGAMESSQIAATGVCRSAHDLWNKIKENHEGAISNLRSTSLAEFLSLKYQKNETIVSYAGRFELSLGKLESTGQTVDEKTKLWVFSNSLPPHMKTTVQMFNMSKPEGEVSELISQLKIQYHMDNRDHDNKGAAYHVLERQQSGTKPHQAMSSIACNYCKRVGHMWKECRKLKADNDRKKSFGQAKQSGNFHGNNRHQPNKQRPINDHHNSKQNKPAGAFQMKQHDFSEGKFSWIVDSGASSHMTPYREFLTNYVEFETPTKIYLGDNRSLKVKGMGDMPFTNDEFEGVLKHVLWVPELSENLFSICRAMEQNCKVEFCNEDSKVFFYRDNQLVLTGVKKPSSIYFLLRLVPAKKNRDLAEVAMVGASMEDWHKRLGHCSMETVKALLQSNAVNGLTISNRQQHECRACIMGKLCRAHHPQREKIKASASAAVLHIDTVGPMKTTSIGGSRYFLLATEEYSGYKLFETLSSKGLIPDAVKRLINQAELDSGRPVKAILTDNGSEFVNDDLNRWISKKGIIHLFSVTYTPQQNGRAERANRTVLDGIRTLINDSDLPEELWGEALNCVVYTTNRLPNKRDQTKTRYELFRSKKPDVSNLKIFGQKAIVREADSARDGKLAPRGEEARFVGYTDRYNTYRFYLEKPVKQIIISCDAKFINATEDKEPEPKQEQFVTIADDEATEIDEDSSDNESLYESSMEDDPDDDSDTTIVESSGSTETRPVTRSMTNVRPESAPAVGAKEGAMFTLNDEPRTFKDAQESKEWANWKQAMDEEIEALEKNKTWVLINRPPNIRPIKNKWVYKAKLKPDGSVDRFKARLVAKGFTQIPNVDYKETYAPVASMTTIRLFLAIATQLSMQIVQFDIKTAFLYGDLDEELYMEQPDHYVTDPNKVCKLIKSLYGLKQAPRQWNKKFDSFLKTFSLQQSDVDKCLYFSKDKSLLLAIYVDDGLAAGQNKKQLDNLIAYLKENFEMKVMNCEHYLGFEITRDLKAKTLSICQATYVDKILTRFGMEDCKVANTPEEVGAKFNQSELLPTDNQFKELVGSLLYLTTCSRPDIAHAVSIASRTSQPTQAHWVALKRILRYLKGTKDYGIRFRWENPNELVGYSDADYANDEETRKSTTGYCIFFGGAPISWRCQRQPIITLSTTEAEYVAGCELVKEMLPIRQLLIELNQIDDKKPVKVLIDNQSTVKIACSESGQNRTKHIDIREKWLTEQVMKKTIEVEHISGDEQPADILTKPLHKTKFMANRSKLVTQIISVMAMIALCSSSLNARELKTVSATTPIKSEKVYIKGDTRMKLTNVFMYPCENLLSYSTSVFATELQIRLCNEYFIKKHMNVLSNCKRLPDVGPDLYQIPPSYNCIDNSNGVSGGTPEGKCDMNRRDAKASRLPELELEQLQESWDKHRKMVENLPTLRHKRFLPFVAGVILMAVFSGPALQTYKLAKTNADNIEQLVNVTDLHSKIIKDSTEFFGKYRDSVSALHTWAEEVEERLGDDPNLSRLNADPIYRGKKANLIKTYMQWFDNQEKLLLDINEAAGKGKISPSMKNMLNGTGNFDIAANLSTLFGCSYRLEHKNFILDMEFLLPVIDEDIEIMKLLTMDIYRDRGEDICWETYTGPSYVMHNKTNGCMKSLTENKVGTTALRGQVCLDPPDDKNGTLSSHWEIDSCSKQAPLNEERIQIVEINGVHKIYCYPFEIELDNSTQPCPASPFILEGHASYKIGNITHQGAYIDNSISRRIRSTSNRVRPLVRHRRSPVPPTMAALPTPTPSTTTKPAIVESPQQPKTRIGETLRNLTGQMNNTLTRIQQTVKLLPEKLNITKNNLNPMFLAPFNFIQDGLDQLAKQIESAGTFVGCITMVVVFLMLMPVIELIIVSFRIAKIPANLWLGSVRRVSSSVQWASTNSIPSLFKNKKRKRWDDTL